ncbi:putative spermidine/putrescine transport system substrate-binding protein [Monaibacterium marinum]|uniref:Putative spermidine/putrescine transport system substrate-binding protein n=1 Tax=Pontivivens marinum TaxID=1690039 RepID=A0A2C9CP98_9RHOB|nr:ABC transporter substrate-binding protein [Monaibacterium marinum]SOH92189.1 putative spermidine/putrescine transport system substrate-binding protein [Monaibacterium marinum]
MKKTLISLSVTATLLANTAMAQDADAVAFRDAFLAGTATWEDVQARAAEEGAVNLYYWGGSDPINIWMDRVVTPDLAELGVTLNPVRITGTKDAIDLVLAEMGSGRGLGEGSVDAIWLNGENFATLQRQDALFGSFAGMLPNSGNVEWNEEDPRSLLNLRDFGVETNQAEMPWSGEQYVCATNTNRLASEDVPHTFAELLTYLQENPGKFTYVKPPHYVGNTFVQAAVYAHNPDGTGAEPFQSSIEDMGAEELARLIAPGLEYLKELDPYLLGAQSGNALYAEDNAALDGMFLNGEVDIACKFGLYAVATGLNNGTYPEGAEAFVFPEGNMIKNKNYLAIPANAPNPAATLIMVDYMTSVQAQVTKLQFTGMPPGVDPWTLTDEEVQALTDASPGLIGVTQAELDANTAPDTNASLVDVIEATWLEYIERDSTDSIDVIVARAVENLAQ